MADFQPSRQNSQGLRSRIARAAMIACEFPNSDEEDCGLRALIWTVLKPGNGRALHMRVPLDLCCSVLLHEPPFTGTDGLSAYCADNGGRILEPHRVLRRPCGLAYR